MAEFEDFLNIRLDRKKLLGFSAQVGAALVLPNFFNLRYSWEDCKKIDAEVPTLRPPLVGAIRWGGWFRGSEWSQNLQDARWRDRLPYFSKINPDTNKVEIVGDRQEVMDQGIEYAKRAGLDYWAYCFYDRRTSFDSYNYGINLHLNSTVSDGPKIAAIIQGEHFSGAQGWDGFTDNLVRLFENDKYQKVAGKRPLVFIFSVDNFNKEFEYYDKSAKALDHLREKTVRMGLGQPYIVAQNVSGEVVHLGFDAFGAYTANGTGPFLERPYTTLMQSNIDYWESIKAEGRRVVPLINAGWDPRPRLNHPVYGKWYRSMPWYAQPTPEQLAHHVHIGIDWIRNNPGCSAEDILLIYAWNEYDEGGWLAPTLYEGTKRLDAVAKVLLPTKAA